MSSLKNTSVDGKLMTENEMKMAIDRNTKKGRKTIRISKRSWVSFDEQTMTTTTEGQTEVITDGHTTWTTKDDGQISLIIKGKVARFIDDEQATTSEPETPTDEPMTLTLMTEGQTTATGQAMMSDGQTATLTETLATTSDGGTTLTNVDRRLQLELHRTLFREGRDGTKTDGRTLSTDEQFLVTEEQTMETMVEQTMGTDGQTMMLTATTEEEQAMAAEVDPLALSPSTSGVASNDPMISHYSVEDTLLASPEKEVQNVDDGCDTNSAESLVGVGRKVVGRERAVVVDEDSDKMSIVSISSVDEDYSMATSSSRPGQGVKRRRKPVEGKGKTRKESDEERKGKKKGRKGVVGKKDTPEEEEVGIHGEPKGIFDHDLEDMPSEVLGGAIQDWADSIEDIRSKSKNMQGRLSGVMKRSVAKIKEGTALLVVRSTASGDPEFLRMRNSELEARLQEAKREIVRLQERLKKSPELPSPPRKRMKERAMKADVAEVVSADLADSVDPPSPEEAFPPLPQRAPCVGVARDGSVKRKVGPRIVSDIQVAPPFKDHHKEKVTIPAVPRLEAEWRVAAGSRRRGRVKGDKPPLPPPPPPVPAEGRPPPASRQQPKVRLPRPPSSSAVTITGRSEGFSYAEAMKSARKQIDLDALGIRTTRVRKALNGGLLIEVSGEDSRAKAEELVAKLRNVLKDSAAISCPVKKRELTVVGFDESVSSEEIAEALSAIGGCPRMDIKMGPIRNLNNGLGIVWVQLPVAAAAKVAEEGRIRVGWTMARVELLKVRPLQCYKCWSFGHVQTTCRSIVDRRGACFRCGQKGHVASACTNPVHCAVCHDAGVEASHRLGGPQCAAQERQDAK